MARPQKKGLSYFPFDVDFFSDKKIKRLRAKYGTDGVMVYIYLLCEIYRSGYYIEYDEDLLLDISDELNISENLTKQIVNYLLSRSLFDNTLAMSVKVLTAKSVQLRYQEAKKGAKRDIEVEAKYWLLEKENTQCFIKLHPHDGISRNNNSFSEKYSDKSENNHTKKSKVKESKEKESKVENNAAETAADPLQSYGDYSHIKLTETEHKKLISDFGEEKVRFYIGKIDKWCQLKGGKYSDYNLAIREWIAKDDEKNANTYDSGHSYDLDAYKALANDFGEEA